MASTVFVNIGECDEALVCRITLALLMFSHFTYLNAFKGLSKGGGAERNLKLINK